VLTQSRWPDPRRARPVQDQSVFFLKNFTFKGEEKAKTEILEMGNYEFPFEVLLPGNMPETVEGLCDCWIEYRIKATISRGRLAHSLYARKSLRVVRTLAPNSLELSHAMVRVLTPLNGGEFLWINWQIVCRKHLARQTRIRDQHPMQSSHLWHMHQDGAHADPDPQGPTDWENNRPTPRSTRIHPVQRYPPNNQKSRLCRVQHSRPLPDSR
jgi:Arrestin (or S-antigen), N-terminal domain